MWVVRCLGVAAAALPLVASPAFAASKRTVALLGDAAPRGGVFAGPSFRQPPAAAGNGMLAFRAQIAGGPSGEQIVRYDVAANDQRAVAGLGQALADGSRLKQFLGAPAVNARGDVAFVATLTPAPDAPRPGPTDPVPAAVLLYAAPGPLEVVALSGQETEFGVLDLATPVGFGATGGGADLPERTPALDDRGTVTFLAGILSRSTLEAGVFSKPRGGPMVALARSGTAATDGRLVLLGQPSASPGGIVAFRALVEHDEGTRDLIFRVVDGEAVPAVASGFEVVLPDDPFGVAQPVDEFGDGLGVNDAGDIAFFGGPLLDLSGNASTDDLRPGVFLLRGGEPTPRLVAWPGRTLPGFGRLSGFNLGTQFGAQPTPPSVTPEGAVVFHALLNADTSGAVVRVDPPYGRLVPLLLLGGSTPSSAPLGGTFLAAASAPAVDAGGGIALVARFAGSETSEALVYVPSAGPTASVRIGDAAPTQGFYGGPPFSPPQLNDAGTVVFKSYVARGTGSSGIFRWNGSALDTVVQVGDEAPLDGTPPPRFAELPGEPSLGPGNEVAFAAVLSDGRRGIFLATPQGLRPVAVQRQEFPDPSREAAWFRRIPGAPVIVGPGAVVAFRAAIEYPDPDSPFGAPSIVEEGLFASDARGLRLLAVAGERSPEGRRYYRFRDASGAADRIAFRAQLGTTTATGQGLFLLEPGGVLPVAIENQRLPSGPTVESLNGRAAVDAAGRIAVLARIRGSGASGQALLHGRPQELTPVAVAGQAGPAGGILRSLGRPSLSSAGQLVFRAGIQPFTGGFAGLYLARPGEPPSPYLVVGERGPTGVGGRITNVNQYASVNAAEDVAFLATLAEGATRAGIFLASRADLHGTRVDVRLGSPRATVPRDRLRVRATLLSGRHGNGIGPQAETVTLTVGDATRTLWAAVVPKEALRRRGTLFAVRRDDDRRRIGLKSLIVRMLRDGRAVVRARPTARDFTVGGAAPLVPPLVLRLEIGDDSATAVLPCAGRAPRLRCSQAR